MKFHYKLFLFSVIAISLSACSPAYFPPRVNAPLFEEGGETKINYSYSGSSMNLSGAHSLNDHWLIGGGLNGFIVQEGSVNGSPTGGSSGYQADLLGGYYSNLGNGAIFEGVFGGGISSVGSDDVTGTAYRAFIQPTMGFRGKIIEGGLSFRITDFINDEQVYVGVDALGADIYRQEVVNRVFMEPALSFRIGGPKVKFTTQMLVSFPVTETDIEYQPLVLNLGVQLLIKK